MKKKIGMIIALLLVAILSCTAVSRYASNADNYSEIIQELDNQKKTAMGLTAGVAGASTLISLLPDDTGSSIAEKLTDLTTPLLLITCVLYLEKFLLTTLGYMAFTWVIPIACGLAILYLLRGREFLKSLAIKLFVLGCIVPVIIPTSVTTSMLIQDTFDESIEQTLDQSEEYSKEAEKASEDKEGNIVLEWFKNVKNKATGYIETAENLLSNFIDAIAIMLITTCVMPLLVVFCFMTLIKTIFGLNINTKAMAKMALPKHKKEELPCEKI